MRLLVLGGTVFLGRHVVEAALARGDEVTLLNRGRHGADLYPEAERLVGDRDGTTVYSNIPPGLWAGTGIQPILWAPRATGFRARAKSRQASRS